MASLSEIAQICGVSIGSASKALTGQSGVSDATRERIRSVAAQHHYYPNRLVHAIQKGRSMTVGLACKEFRDDFTGRIIEGMLTALYRAEYDAVVISWELSIHDGEKVLRTLTERRVDGLLMFPPSDQPSHAYLQELKSFRKPIVVVDQTFAGVEEYSFVGSQDHEGGELATGHLIELEHTRIAYIFHRKTSTGRARLNGFRSTMERHGLPIRQEWMCELQNYGSDEAYTHARKLLAMESPPSAIICFNDWVAMDVIAAAYDCGLRVPDDVSVIGFGNLHLASTIRPRLTSIDQDPTGIGNRAASHLLDTLGLPGKLGNPIISSRFPVCDRVPVKLIARESTKPFTD